MMLDEIDKMGAGIQGDPVRGDAGGARPGAEQHFRDNYLAVPFDLSRVMFIATANMLDTIPGPLRDRMEIISLAGYTDEEKLQIAAPLPGPAPAGGQRPDGRAGEIDDEALREIIDGYTREAGVRSLEREIGRAVAPRRGAASPRATPSQVRIDARRPRRDPRPAALRERSRHAHQRAGRRHRASPGRRSAATSCSSRRPSAPGNGKLDPHRPARRRDEGKRAGGAQPGQEPRGVARHRSGGVREERHPHPRAGGRHAQGRAERRRGHVHRARLRCSPAAPCAATPP